MINNIAIKTLLANMTFSGYFKGYEGPGIRGLKFAQVTISCSMPVKMESHNTNSMVLSMWPLTLLSKENVKEGDTSFSIKLKYQI